MLTCPGRRFRLRLKTSVTAVLLIAVFISSSFLIGSAHARTTPPATGTVTLIPNVGSCNPFANVLPNSGRFLVASGYDDLSGSAPFPSIMLSSDPSSYVQGSGQVVREAAVYANGNQPMAIASAYASETSDAGQGKRNCKCGIRELAISSLQQDNRHALGLLSRVNPRGPQLQLFHDRYRVGCISGWKHHFRERISLRHGKYYRRKRCRS